MIFPCGKMRANCMMMVLSLQCSLSSPKFFLLFSNQITTILMRFSMQFDNFHLIRVRFSDERSLSFMHKWIYLSNFPTHIPMPCISIWFSTLNMHFQFVNLQMRNYPWNEVRMRSTLEFNFEMNQNLLNKFHEKYSVML